MKCKNCGHKNKRNAQFCIACGEPLDSGGGNSKLIYILIVFILILIVAVGFLIFNGPSSDDSAPVVNNTTDNNESINNTDSDIEDVVNNTTSNENENKSTSVNPTISQTIVDENLDYIQIYGVSFTVPTGGSHRTACAYQFGFKGQTCEVEEVEHYEYSDSEKTIEPYVFSKSYPGGEGYKLTVNNHVWKGIKVEKSDKWFHISMKTDDDEEVLELLDWMYERNNWVGHE